MSNNYNHKEGQLLEKDNPYLEKELFQEKAKKERRKDSILNSFVFLIGFVGFVYVFFLPRDLVYGNQALEYSFTNKTNSPTASSSLESQNPNSSSEQNGEDLFHIDGFLEVGESLQFVLEKYNPGVNYTIEFGNGVKREMSESVMAYNYPNSGNYNVKVTATYQGAEKIIFEKHLYIDDAIIVKGGALSETH